MRLIAVFPMLCAVALCHGVTKSDLIRVHDFTWMVLPGHYEQAASNRLNHSLGKKDMAARGCSDSCAKSFFAHVPGGVYGNCSQACLESLLPAPWKRLWERNVPAALRSTHKPSMLPYDEKYEFGGELVEYSLDSSFFCFIDEAGYLAEYEYKVSIAYDKWEVRNDSLILMEGTQVVTRNFPGSTQSDTTRGLRTADKIRWIEEKKSDASAYRNPRQFRFKNQTLYETIVIGL